MANTIRSKKIIVKVTEMTVIMPTNSPNPDDDAIALVDNVTPTNRVVVNGATGVPSAALDDVAVVVVGSRHVQRASLHVFCVVMLLHGTLPLGGSLQIEIFSVHPASRHVASSEINEQNTLAPLHTAIASFTMLATSTNRTNIFCWNFLLFTFNRSFGDALFRLLLLIDILIRIRNRSNDHCRSSHLRLHSRAMCPVQQNLLDRPPLLPVSSWCSWC